jgi:hypothetical protein
MPVGIGRKVVGNLGVGDMRHNQNDQERHRWRIQLSPRMIGIIAVAGVMALPEVPVGYLTPLAIFVGASAVFIAQSWQRRT